jgi:hypothetical protein
MLPAPGGVGRIRTHVMRVLVLGSAAGGGFPQWNLKVYVCLLARADDSRVLPLAQASVAVSADGSYWLVLNASPDLRQQIEANAALHPSHAAVVADRGRGADRRRCGRNRRAVNAARATAHHHLGDSACPRDFKEQRDFRCSRTRHCPTPRRRSRTQAYVTPRLTQAPQDVDFALAYVKRHSRTVPEQAQVLAALRFKCDVRWSQLDGLHYAYVEPVRIPPGAFVPEGMQHSVAAA